MLCWTETNKIICCVGLKQIKLYVVVLDWNKQIYMLFFVTEPTRCINFFNMFIALLYMFRATMCIYSEEYRTHVTPGICLNETSGYFKITRFNIILLCWTETNKFIYCCDGLKQTNLYIVVLDWNKYIYIFSVLDWNKYIYCISIL